MQRTGRQTPDVAVIDKPKINQRKEVAPCSNSDLVNAILQAFTYSVGKEEIMEAEDLIRELKNSDDKTKCEKALAHKRAVMAGK